MPILLPEGKQSFETVSGTPLIGGRLYTYDAGTNNLRPTYRDAAGVSPNTNPVVLDARGEATIFWDGAYKVELRDSLDVVIWTVDNVISNAGQSLVVNIADVPYSANPASADNTAIIQSAINAAYGGVLWIPEGVFIVTALTVSDSLTIAGPGTLKQKNNTSADMITLSGTDKKFVIQDITLDGNEQNQIVASTNRTVRFTAVGNALSTDVASVDFIHCTFKNGAVADITVFNDAVRTTTEKVSIQNCKFFGGREGTSVGYDPRYVDIRSPVDYIIMGNMVDLLHTPVSFGRAGFIIYDGNAGVSTDKARGVIVGNYLRHAGRNESTSSLGSIDVYTYARTVTITGNTISSGTGRCIQVKADAENVVIANNTCDGLTSGIDSQIVVNGSVNTDARGNIVISGNTLLASSRDGISVTGDNSLGTVWANGISITGNTIKTATRRGIGLISLTDAVVTGNVVDTCQSAIYADEVKESLVVSANRFNDTSDVTVYIASTCDTATINVCGNDIQDSAIRGIFVGACAGGVIANNTIRDTTNTAIDVNNVGGPLLVHGNVTTSATPLAVGGTNNGLVVRDNLWGTALSQAAHLLTIGTGVVTAYLDWHRIDTEGAAATDDLDTINGGFDGQLLTICAANSARDVVVKDNTGNLVLNGDFTMTNVGDTITLRKINGTWHELCRSDNAA